jgi:GrpB-like predicted nucleotidyltransferase (UPF0157 family)
VTPELEKRIKELIQDEILIVPYNPEWPELFVREAGFLRAKLPLSIVRRIEHFGSTAVPGLAAKPIIDLLVEVTSLTQTKQEIVPILQSLGYEYFWRFDCKPPYAWFIKRNPQGIRTHHIHMVESDSVMWERLYFRDYLREFPEEARQYEQLKYSLSQKYRHDHIGYTNGKTEFVRSLTERAKQHCAG